MTTPSITVQPVFRPKMTREVHMEDLRAAYVAFIDRLEERGVHFASLEDDNGFHDSMWLFLEESFNWPDYTSHN